MTYSYTISDSLWLVSQPIDRVAKPVQVRPPVNHLMVLDCSGSMSGDLPRIREQLKRRIPMLLQKDDTLSVVWFSGKGQFGVLLDGEPVATLTDLQAVYQAIDRWIRPVGMTGFKEPLVEVTELAKRLSAKRPGSVASLVFMSDGYDNQWTRQQVLQAAEQAGVVMASTTIVEYGYYADRALLASMAEVAGGQLVFSQDFSSYAPSVENCLTKGISGSPKISVQLLAEPLQGVLFSLESELVQYQAQDGKVLVPESVGALWYLSGNPVGSVVPLAVKGATEDQALLNTLQGAFGAIATLSLKGQPELIYQLLRVLGDVQVIRLFGGCFGKQRYSEFRDHCIKLATGAVMPFQEGCDPTAVPDDDCFTVMDLLRTLSEDEDCRLLLDSKDFHYRRIGRAQVENTDLTDEEADKVQLLTDSMRDCKDAKKLASISQDIQAIVEEAAKRSPLKFVPNPSPNGYEVSKLTFAEDRANCSVLIRKEGTCQLPADRPGGVPEKFETFIWRNYAIVRDGIVNVERLPVRLPKGVCRALIKAGLPESCLQAPAGEDREAVLQRFRKAASDRHLDVVLDLSKLPVLNRSMVKRTSAEHLFRLCWDALKAKASQKVAGGVSKDLFPQKSGGGLADQYGQEAATWLQERGLTDGGFSPRTKQAESTDCYMAKELEVKIKGFASLPSMNELNKKVASGKPLTGAAKLMGASRSVILGAFPKLEASPELQAYLDKALEQSRQEARRLMFEIAQSKFSVIVGQVWFQEFETLEQNTMTLTLDGQDVLFTAEMREVETKI